jgi:hypothetical protein
MTETHSQASSLYEDLTFIDGIGQTRQKLLREQLHVRTLADFAALSPQEIASTLRAQGQPIALEKIEAWQAEAHAFARAHVPKGESETVIAEAPHDAQGCTQTHLVCAISGRGKGEGYGRSVSRSDHHRLRTRLESPSPRGEGFRVRASSAPPSPSPAKCAIASARNTTARATMRQRPATHQRRGEIFRVH